MNQKQIEIIKKQLHVTGGQVTTTSHAVASAFDKRHDHVLRDIEELECSPEFRSPNFGEISVKDKYGREQRAFELTKDGFWLLAMGYKGKLAMRIKEAYIAAFNQMEKVICSNMAEARADAVIGTLAISAAIARAGYKADFLARMVHLRYAGLTVKEVGRVLGVSKDVVVRWSSVLRKAGVDFPKSANPSASLLKSASRQLCLPWMQS